MADHLEELLRDTPMGRMKLLAAWDSLSAETHIRLLEEMREKGRTSVGDRPIWLKALSSQSEYVRYLAARTIGWNRDDDIWSRVTSDPSPLVRYSCASGMRHISNEYFDRYPKERRLAMVSANNPFDSPIAKKVALWIERAVETKNVSDDKLYDVVLEYLCNPEAMRQLHESSYDFFDHKSRLEGLR